MGGRDLVLFLLRESSRVCLAMPKGKESGDVYTVGVRRLQTLSEEQR